MNPCNRSGPRASSWWTLILTVGVVVSSGCSGGDPGAGREATTPVPLVQAEATPLPDFRSYVVGPLESPVNADRDPFSEAKPGSSPSVNSKPRARHSAPVRFSLRGIVERDGQRVALLARGPVRVGESVAGWQVEEIGERTVVLRRGTNTKRLSL